MFIKLSTDILTAKFKNPTDLNDEIQYSIIIHNNYYSAFVCSVCCCFCSIISKMHTIILYQRDNTDKIMTVEKFENNQSSQLENRKQFDLSYAHRTLMFYHRTMVCVVSENRACVFRTDSGTKCYTQYFFKNCMYQLKESRYV